MQPTRQPTQQPSSQPSTQPSFQPSRQPSLQPTRQPSCQPSSTPTRQPSSKPTSQPSIQPSLQPTGQPSLQPSCQPSCQPSFQPSHQPSSQPSCQPTSAPTSYLGRIENINKFADDLLSNTFNCSKLHRITLETGCGKCTNSYIGDDVSTTVCIKNTINLESTSKLCPNRCSNNGTCAFIDLSSGLFIDNCNILSLSCKAKCMCIDNMMGADCSLSYYQIQAMQSSSIAMLENINGLFAETNVITTEIFFRSFNSTINILNSNINDIKSELLLVSDSVVDKTIVKALELKIPVTKVAKLTDAVSNIIYSSIDNDEKKSDIQVFYENYVDTIGKMAFIQSSSLNISLKNIELSVEILKPTLTIKSLSSDLSQKYHVIHVNQSALSSNHRKLTSSNSNNVTVMLSVTRASLYSNSSIPYLNNKIEDRINNNPLRLQFNCSRQQNVNILVTLVNYATRDYSTINSSTLAFSTKCSNRNETFNYICKYPDSSRYTVSFACSSKMNQTYITTCPSRRKEPPSCEVRSSFGKCTMIDYTNEYTICSCNICSTNNNTSTNRHRKLQSLKKSSEIQAFHFVSMTSYVFDDYVSKMSQADNEQVFEDALVVSVTFAAVWILIVSFFMFKRWSKVVSRLRKTDDKTNSDDKLSSVVPILNCNDYNATTHENKREILRNYLYSYLPAVFRERSGFHVGRYLMSYHLQYSLLMNTYRKTSDEFTFWMNGFHFASLISANMFVIAVIFSLKYPTNNGKCEKYSLKDDCLSEKIYDGQSFCTWFSSNVWTGCYRQPNEFDLNSLTFIAVLQFVLLSPVCSLITVIFDRFIYPPFLSEFFEQKRKETELLNDFILIPPSSSLPSRSSSSSSSSSVKNEKPIIKTINLVNDFIANKRKVFEAFHTRRSLRIDCSSSNTVRDYKRFLSSFNNYRNGLSDEKKMLLDNNWSSIFHHHYSIDKNGMVTFTNSNVIVNALDNTEIDSNRIYDHLKHSTANTIGTELIKLFLIDVLGRHSNDAKIFNTIIEKEFKSEIAVSRGLKYFFIIMIIVLNLYFLYATMLYSKGTGYDWQYHWVVLLVINICFDLGISQPLKIYIKQYLIPITIKDTILQVRDTLDSLIRMILKNSKYRSKKMNLFSISDYFFVSTRLAMRRPELIESYLILSYRSPYPKNQFSTSTDIDIAIETNSDIDTNTSNTNTNNESLLNNSNHNYIRPHGILGALTLLGNFIKAGFFRIVLAPAIVQDVILDVLKPLIPMGIVFTVYNIQKNKFWYIGVGVIGLIIITSTYYCFKSKGRVLPFNNTDNDHHDVMYSDHYENLKMPPPPKNPGNYPNSLDDEKADEGQGKRQAPPPNSIGSHPILVQKLLVNKNAEVDTNNDNIDSTNTENHHVHTAALFNEHLAKVSAQLFDDDVSSSSSDDSFM